MFAKSHDCITARCDQRDRMAMVGMSVVAVCKKMKTTRTQAMFAERDITSPSPPDEPRRVVMQATRYLREAFESSSLVLSVAAGRARSSLASGIRPAPRSILAEHAVEEYASVPSSMRQCPSS